MRNKNAQRHLESSGIKGRINTAYNSYSGKQIAFSEELGVTQPQVNNYLNGKSFPRLEILQKLALTLHVNYIWLRYGHGKMDIETDRYPTSLFKKSPGETLVYYTWTQRFTVGSIARELSVSNTAVQYWMTGKRRIRGSVAQKLGILFKVDPECFN